MRRTNIIERIDSRIQASVCNLPLKLNDLLRLNLWGVRLARPGLWFGELAIAIITIPRWPGPRRPDVLARILLDKFSDVLTHDEFFIVIVERIEKLLNNVCVNFDDIIILVVFLNNQVSKCLEPIQTLYTLAGKPSSGWLNHRTIASGSVPTSPSIVVSNRAATPVIPA